MKLRQERIPEIEARRPPNIAAFSPDPKALERWAPEIRAAAGGDATISILDVIGDDFDGGTTVKRISAALRSIGERDVTVNLNSPGGDFFEGVAIYNALRQHRAKVTVNILGLAASAASVIAMAGDDIRIGKAGFIMVHNAWAISIGNRHDLREAADLLEPFDSAMAAVYAARSGADKAEAAAWMDAERWFTGEQAIEAGLADGLLPADAITEDASEATRGLNAKRRIEAALAREGMSRDQRRSLIGTIATPDDEISDDWADTARARMQQLLN